MTLTLVNTLMLGGFVAGPGIARVTGGWWQGYQRWRADRAAAQQRAAVQQKFLADYQACLNASASPTQVVYEEDPTRAAAMLKGGNDYVGIPSSNYVYFPPAPWQVPIVLKSTGLAAGPLSNRQCTIAFLHSRKAPNDIERLVCVEFLAQETMRKTSDGPDTRYYHLKNDRIFTTRAYDPAPDGTLHVANSRSLTILQPPDHNPFVVWNKAASWESGRIEPHLRDVMRVFAGQPDPNDASHFTIGYELDGAPGVIDGWLVNDQTVVLEPRLGRIISQDSLGRQRNWDPYADPPATRPADPNLLVPAIPPRPRNTAP
jgi:hypothetical protein